MEEAHISIYIDFNKLADPTEQLSTTRKIRRAHPKKPVIVHCEKPSTPAQENYLLLFEEFHPEFRYETVNGPTGPEYDISQLDIPASTMAVCAEFFHSLCDYTVLNKFRIKEMRGNECLGDWLSIGCPPERQLFIEDSWSEELMRQAKSLFILPDVGILDRVVERGPWPALRLIIVHNGDTQINYKALLPFLDTHPDVYAWIQNNIVEHPQIRTLPIVEQDRIWRGGRKDWDPPVNICRKSEREGDILYTYCSATNPIRVDWLNEVMPLRTTLAHLDLYSNRIPNEEYIELLQSYKMVLSPPGNGVDTHRAWESIENGAWAIVQNNAHTRCLLREYPSLPLIPIDTPKDLSSISIQNTPCPFHPVVLRPFWTTIFHSYIGP